MSDEETITDIDPEILEDEGLFLDEDDLGLDLGLDEDEDADLKLSVEEE